MRRVVLFVGALVLVAGLGLGLARVGALSGEELDRSGDALSINAIGSESLVRGDLWEGQEAFFEVCAEDSFARGWEEVAFEVWHLGDDALAQRVEAAEWLPHVQPGAQHACVVVARWESVLVGGEYGLRMAGRPTAEGQGRVRGRVAAWRALADGDLWGVVLGFAGGLLLLLGLALRPADPTTARSDFQALADETLEAGPPAVAEPSILGRWTARPPWLRVTVALAVFLAAMIGLSVLGGTLLGLVRALALAAVQLVLAFAFIAPRASAEGEHPRRSIALGLVRPWPGWWVLVLASVVGFGIWLAGAWLSQLVPSTGLSPVEAFVSYPSGSLALAVVAVVVPIAEELFFRGFVFGALEERRGPGVAFVVTALVFALAHLPQQWGAWGPFVSVTFTGLMLTALRLGTRSTITPALAHLTHNALITALALAG